MEHIPPPADTLVQRYRALVAQAKALADQRAAVLQEAAAIAAQAGIPHATRSHPAPPQRWRGISEESRYGHE